MSYDPESPSVWERDSLTRGGAGSPLEFDGQLWARIGTRSSMVRVEQGRPAYGQDWTSRNLSVIPLGTKVMDASLPP